MLSRATKLFHRWVDLWAYLAGRALKAGRVGRRVGRGRRRRSRKSAAYAMAAR